MSRQSSVTSYYPGFKRKLVAIYTRYILVIQPKNKATERFNRTAAN